MSVIIGITHGYNNCEEKELTISSDYVKAIKKAGGIPVMLPPHIDKNDVPYLINILKGILISGGGDVDPRFFGENPHKGLKRIDPVRDSFEIQLCRKAIKNDVPLLAICRGMQVLNIACGGTIIQNIEGETIKHEQESPKWHPSHRIEIKDNNLLFDIYKKRKIYVNSFHHQAIGNLGKNLEIAALAPDGLIEGIVGNDTTFTVGVQWHPEKMFEKIPQHLKLFNAFINSTL